MRSTVCLLYVAGTDVNVRSECLRKLSSHTPMFELGRNAEEGTVNCLDPDSEICVESNAHLFGIHPFYIPRGRQLCLYRTLQNLDTNLPYVVVSVILYVFYFLILFNVLQHII